MTRENKTLCFTVTDIPGKPGYVLRCGSFGQAGRSLPHSCLTPNILPDTSQTVNLTFSKSHKNLRNLICGDTSVHLCSRTERGSEQPYQTKTPPGINEPRGVLGKSNNRHAHRRQSTFLYSVASIKKNRRSKGQHPLDRRHHAKKNS